MKTHVIAITVFSVVAASSTFAQTASLSTPPTFAFAATNDVVARVNGVAVNRHELSMAVQGLVSQLQRQGRVVSADQQLRIQHDVLDGLIDRLVVLQTASTNPPPDLQQKLKETLDRTRAMAGGEEALAKSLQENGVNKEEYERRTRDNVIVIETLRHVAEDRAKITDEEAKAFYDANVARFKQPGMVRASHILVAVAPDANEETKKSAHTKISAARSLVIGGEKFGDIARKVSDDTGSATRGGDLGFFPRGVMAPEFEKRAFSLSTNQVSEVFSTPFGYHFLVVVDQKAEKKLSFDEVKSDIANFLRNRKNAEVLRDYITGLRAKSKVEVFLPPLPASMTQSNAPAAATSPKTSPPKP
jgi:peptidyl-prolyl cis-trans isomerase C